MYGFRTPKGTKNYLHLSNEGFERRVIFSSQEDYDRFEAYLYLLNAVESPRAANYFVGDRFKEIFETARGERLVAIGAYSLLARDFSILATPLVEGGISKFMQKIQTAYTMYFNKKYQRTGRLFQAAYKSIAAQSEEHLLYLLSDIHLQPAELFDQEWRTSESYTLRMLAARALQYRYSSAGEYIGRKFKIVDTSAYPKTFLRATNALFHTAAWNKGVQKFDRVQRR